MLFLMASTSHSSSYPWSIPPFHDVANAVGAAIAKVSGDVDTIEIVQSQQLSEILKRLKTLALSKAVAAGADLASVSITEINILPVQVCLSPSGSRNFSFRFLQYVTNQATRIIVKAIGELGVPSDYTPPEINTVYQSDLKEEPEPTQETILPGSDGATGIDYLSYRPKIVDNEWILSETDLCEYMKIRNTGMSLSQFFVCAVFIQEGCGVLGTVRHCNRRTGHSQTHALGWRR
jgi:hypothetical protein